MRGQDLICFSHTVLCAYTLGMCGPEMCVVPTAVPHHCILTTASVSVSCTSPTEALRGHLQPCSPNCGMPFLQPQADCQEGRPAPHCQPAAFPDSAWGSGSSANLPKLSSLSVFICKRDDHVPLSVIAVLNGQTSSMDGAAGLAVLKCHCPVRSLFWVLGQQFHDRWPLGCLTLWFASVPDHICS